MRRYKSIVAALVMWAILLSGCNAGGSEVADASEPAASGPMEEEPQQEPELDEETEPPEEEFPDSAWAFDLPENHGVDPALLDNLHQALIGTDIYSVVTVKDGYIIDEFYQQEYDETSVFRLASVTKSFTSALIGIAIDEGLIDGVDVSITAYFPQLAGTDKEDITIRHLLEHTSGIEWYEWNGGNTFGVWTRSDNWVDYVLEQPMASTPGATFNYSTGGPHLLAAILQQAAGVTEYEYAVEHLFRPMGMDSVQWREDEQGITDGGNGISMTARDAAKFGQLYLQGGVWKDRQLVPQSWVEQSTSQQSSGIGRSGVYGYQWWIRPFGDREYDTYYAMGHAGQFIFVVPELELVTVITSSMSQDTYAPWPYFTDYILAACG